MSWKATEVAYELFFTIIENFDWPVDEWVLREADLLRRQLDKLRYEKKKKTGRFFNLQLERATLLRRHEEETQKELGDRMQQQLMTSFQRSMAKQNAAKAIRSTYLSMINILKKDTVHSEAILRDLEKDQRHQCNVIYDTVVMGQLATEDLDDTRKKYKKFAREVWRNMREREKALKIVREKVDDLWAYEQSLIRVNSEMKLDAKDLDDTEYLEKQLRRLEEILDKVKNSLLVRSYHELLPRLEEQRKQRARLIAQLEQNTKEREFLVNKNERAALILSTLRHSIPLSDVEQRATNEKVILEELKEQKKRELDRKAQIKAQGEMLMNVRATLQNLSTMLICMKRGRKKAKDAERKVERDKADAEDEQMMEKMEPDSVNLLSKLSKQVGTLFGMSSFDLDEEKEERARDLYQTYVSEHRSKMKFGTEEPEPTGLDVEHETVDPSVLTRADIKLRSKQLIQRHLKQYD